MGYDLYDESTIKHNLQLLAEKVESEKEKETPDKDKITKLMFAQLMQGLYLQTI